MNRVTPSEERTARARVGGFYDRFWPRNVPPLEASRAHLASLLADGEIPGRRALDAGCGAAVFSAVLAGKGARVVALDVSAGSLAAARRTWDAAICYARGDLLALPFPDASFGLVWSWGAAHHTAEPWRALGELARVVAPGGRLVVALYRRTGLTWMHEAARVVTRRTPGPLQPILALLLALALWPIVALFKRREKARKGERLSALAADWFFVPERHFFAPGEVAAFFEARGFEREMLVPYSGRFNSTSNFVLKLRRKKDA